MSAQEVILGLTVMMALVLIAHDIYEKKESPKFIKLLLVVFQVCAVLSVFFSFKTTNENDALARPQFDTLALDLDLARRALENAALQYISQPRW